jgi:hypothetical protein
MSQEPRPAARMRAGTRALGATGALAAASLMLALVGVPVVGAGLLPSPPIPLPSLPITLPSLPPLPLPTLPPLPLPTLPPLPTPPLPTLPMPTLPLPTVPLPTVPVPTLPLPSGLPGPTSSPPAGSPASSASAGPFTSTAPAGPGLATPASSNAGGAVGSVEGPSADQGPSPFQFVLPLIIAGIPIAVILLIVGLQVAGGAAWLPVIRRWLNRTPTAGP